MVVTRLLIAVYTLLAMSHAASAAVPVKTQANVPAEIVFHATKAHADPFNDVSLDVLFTDPDGVQVRVPAFWDGGDVWKVRYASGRAGLHKYETSCSDPDDRGLNHVHGALEIVPYRGRNPLFKHGPIQVAPDKRHLEYADGTPFFWLGDTWWMGLAKRLHWPDEYQALTADRVKKGFTVIQIVAGLYPDMFPFDERGANEAGYPWEKNYARINPAYFDRADERIRYLVDQGISPCIVGAWGYFMPWMGVEKLERHWRNLIARYGALPVVWCGAGEANLPWYLAPNFPYDDRDQVHQWTEVLRFIRGADPFHRLLTIHPTAINFYTSRHATDDASLLDFDMLQTPHGEEGAAEVALKQTRESYAATPQMPVIDGEAAYEMLSDSLPTRWTRAMFWICMMNGAAGHTYGANGIWQNNRPGDPHGRSPNGPGYGKISSQDAMRLPGSGQLGMAKRLFEKYPWQRFRPHPEWAAYEQNGRATLLGSHWIWFPEGNPVEDAPVAARYFRVAVVLPGGKTITEARLLFSADDAAIAYLNGAKVGESKDWRMGAEIGGLAQSLHTGRNLLAIRAENLYSDVRKNPAGLIAALEVRFSDGSALVVRSDGSWKASQTGIAGWNEPAFDDSSWPAAQDLAPFGAGPWGNIGDADSPIGPQSAGIEGRVRLTYLLRPTPIVVKGLEPGAQYSAQYFDPVTGRTTRIGEVQPDSDGTWKCGPPRGGDHDWLLILEAK